MTRPLHVDPRQMELVERAVRRVKEGISAVMVQSGVSDGSW